MRSKVLKSAMLTCGLLFLSGNATGQDIFQTLKDAFGGPSNPGVQGSVDSSSSDDITVESLPPPKKSEDMPADNPFIFRDENKSGTQFELGSRDPLHPVIPLPEEPGNIVIELEEPNAPGYLGIIGEQVAGGGPGIRVFEVTKDSPAWKAGFQQGDRIVAVEGKAIRDFDDFAQMIASQGANKPVRILIQRGSRTIEMVVVLADRAVASRIANEWPTVQQPLVVPSVDRQVQGDPYLGVSVSTLNLISKRQHNIPVFRGALISAAAPGSPAHRAGLRAGDCIVEIAGNAVQSAGDVQEAIDKLSPGQITRIAYYRGRDLSHVSVVLGNSLPSGQRVPLNDSWSGTTISPEYVRELQDQLMRVQRELDDTQARLRELEQRLEDSDRRRRR